ncbi:MAG: NADPH-dependent oxidoreductase [Bacteroidetes bacterium CG2_30_33_31]|nr:MAG: NADPH-dependent oxidoreductase [Bacteroidetes bacterium CG2_30_33_31]
MNTLATIFNHKSIRKFKNLPVEDEILNNILHAAMRAPSTGNMQLYNIIVTRDIENKRAILPFHFNQKMILDAPVVLTFNADFNRFNLWCEQRNAKPCYDNFLSFITAAIDTVIAAQNAVLAAESQGLGSCYLGTTIYMAEELIKFFELPKGIIPIATLAIGYPDEEPELVDRLPIKGNVHFEKYSNYSKSEIDEIYSYKENLESSKKLIEENKTENLAQIFTEKRYTRESNLLYSNKLLNILKSQGFMNNF